jgi:hypothetical protein
MREDFVDNGPDSTLGNFDPARIKRIIDIVTPILISQRAAPKQGLKPEDLYTNESSTRASASGDPGTTRDRAAGPAAGPAAATVP